MYRKMNVKGMQVFYMKLSQIKFFQKCLSVRAALRSLRNIVNAPLFYQKTHQFSHHSLCIGSAFVYALFDSFCYSFCFSLGFPFFFSTVFLSDHSMWSSLHLPLSPLCSVSLIPRFFVREPWSGSPSGLQCRSP